MTVPPPPRHHAELDLSSAMEDYLKAIYRLEEQDSTVTTQDIADRLQVAPPSVTKMVKRLAERGLVQHRRYYGVQLTETGRCVAQEMVRHHRLLELYLTQALGFERDEVHAEAERLEHFISEKLEDRIDQMLGRPTSDPHGSPIPRRPDALSSAKCSDLMSLDLFAPAIVESVPKAASKLGLRPGLQVAVLSRLPGAKVHIRVEGDEMLLTRSLCAKIVVNKS